MKEHDEEQVKLALTFEGVSKSYRGGKRAVTNFSTSIERGEFFGLLGANGAGKSSLIGMLAGIVSPTSGAIRICGYDLEHQTSAARRCMGIVPQEVNFNVFERVENALISQAGFFGIDRVRAQKQSASLLKRLDLWDKRSVAIRTLSGGMKRRLMLARALMHDPEVLILDEPTAGLDVESRRSIWELLTSLNQKGMTILLTTHYLEEAEKLCQRIAYLHHGQLVRVASLSEWFKELDRETYILTLSTPWKDLEALAPFTARLDDPHTLEIEVPRKMGLLRLMEVLVAKSVPIISLRPNENRLETLLFNRSGEEYDGA